MYYPNGQMAKGTWHHGENLHLDVITTGRSEERRWYDSLNKIQNWFEYSKLYINI